MSGNVLWNIFTSFLDVFSVSIIVYVFLKLLSKNKKNVLILMALLVYAVLFFVARILHLQTLSFILSQIYTWGIIIVVVLFQNEIRASIEKFGSITSLFTSNQQSDNSFVDDFAKEMMSLGERKIGALVVFEMDMNLNQYKKNAISIDGDYSRYLLEAIFLKDSPLHDGAVIMSDDKIQCASAYLPISIDLTIDQQFGTRHRAGLTLASETDAIVVIVSEERGDVSIAYQGNLIDDVELDFLIAFIKEKLEDR